MALLWPTWRGESDRMFVWPAMPLTSWDNGVSICRSMKQVPYSKKMKHFIGLKRPGKLVLYHHYAVPYCMYRQDLSQLISNILQIRFYPCRIDSTWKSVHLKSILDWRFCCMKNQIRIRFDIRWHRIDFMSSKIDFRIFL